MQVTSKSGTTKEFALDFDRICEYEAAHPSWTIVGEFDNVERGRFSSLDLLARFIGAEGWRQFTADGFTIENLTDVVVAGLRDLGFSGDPTPTGSE